MEGYGWVIFSGVVVFFGSLFVYLMFMIFLPEWVGITGAKALAAEASHRGLTPEEIALAPMKHEGPSGESAIAGSEDVSDANATSAKAVAETATSTKH